MTSRAEILTAARRLIDRQGWEKVTVRGLAAEIGVGSTTLYNHVRNKDDLLFLLIHEYAEQIPHPDLPTDPRERIVAAASAIHDALAAWPWAAEVLTTPGFITKLGDSALWLVDTIVAGAIDHGCTPAQAVFLFRSIWYYMVGEILIRVHSAYKWAEEEHLPGADESAGGLGFSHLPHLAEIGEQWGKLAWQDTFPQGLRAFVDGLLAQAASNTPVAAETVAD
jgi:AcrR family transcriptional regulator